MSCGGSRRGLRRSGFLIPMRGNEQTKQLKGVSIGFRFLIPMRGNELMLRAGVLKPLSSS